LTPAIGAENRPANRAAPSGSEEGGGRAAPPEVFITIEAVVESKPTRRIELPR
jgi:hypothetical protein